MKKAKYPSCRMCKDIMVSDANANHHCRMCGMKIEHETDEFCCLDCKKRYLHILREKKILS